MNLMFGVISEIDAVNGLARVYFEEDDFVSAPLKISVMRALNDQVTFPFDVHEHVWCIMDEYCEYGVIGGAVYDDGNKPSGAATGKLLIKFGDTSAIEYDRNSHTLSLNINGKVDISCNEADVTCTTKLKITAPETDITGILNVTGAANISGIASVGGLAAVSGTSINGSTADLSVKSVTATDDVTAGGKSLESHVHTAPSGGGTTSPPV